MLLTCAFVVLLLTFGHSGSLVESACLANQFTCDDGFTCIKLSAVNNSRPDCKDNSDEVAVPYPCNRGQFACGSGECIGKDLVLDGHEDCEDGSDEDKYIGSDCQNGPGHKPCSDFVPQTACIDGECSCDDPYKPDEDKLRCIIPSERPTTMVKIETTSRREATSANTEASNMQVISVTDVETTPLIETEAPTSFRPNAFKFTEERPRSTNKDLTIGVICGITIFVLVVVAVILINLYNSKHAAK